MKRYILPLLAGAACLMTSCFQNEITLRLNKDGSGTLTEETSFGPKALEMITQIAQMSGDPHSDPLAKLSSAPDAEKRAAGLGEGVTLEKAEAFSRDGWKGGRTVFHFKDINKLRYSPDAAAQDMMPKMPNSPPGKQYEPITFTYADGKLVMKLPEPEKERTSPAATAREVGPEQEQMVKQMLADMKMTVKVIAEPGIASTDATHVDGNTITISSIEMGKLMEQPGAIKKLSEASQGSPAEALETMKTFDGVKIESKREVAVTLK